MDKERKVTTLLIVLIVFITVAFMPSTPVTAEPVESPALINFEVYETDIREVFRTLGEMGDLNVLLDPEVKGAATVKLKQNIRIKEAIELIAQTYGYSYRWVNATNTVVIGNEKTFANFESRETKVYQLNYAKPEQIVEAIKVVVKPEQIGVDKRTNQITVRANIIEHQNISEIVKKLDREMPQLNVEARIEEISLTASKKLGIDWTFKATDSTIDFKLTTIATLQALETENKARLLAKPNISTTDSQEGKIFIGDRYPVIISNQTDDGITYKIEYIDIGTTLTVTPRINENDVVTVLVKANVSNISDWKKAGDNDIPVIRTREASSMIRLKDGETFVLSGLNLVNKGENVSQVPGIAKIPIIGRLFQTKKLDPNDNTEIVIFLTPKIVQGKNETIENKNIEVNSKSLASAMNKENVETTSSKTDKMPTPDVGLVNSPTVATAQEQGPPPSENKTTPGAVELPDPEPVVTKTEPSETVTNIPDQVANPAPNPEKIPAAPASTQPTEPVKVQQEPQSLEPVKNQPEPQLTEPVKTPSETKPVEAATGLKQTVNVKKGDSLAGIAKRYGVTVEEIRKENGLKPTDPLGVGKPLVIPIPKEHLYQLKPKETLWRIAKRYGTTVELLQEINNITDITKLEIGQVIILPAPVDKVVDKNY